MSSRRWLVLALVALVAFGLAFAIGGRDDDDPPPAEASLDLDALSVEARELVSLVARRPEGRRHAVYEQSSGDRLEVWLDGERAREELILEDGTRQVAVRGPDGSTTCREERDGWTCTEPDDDPVGIESRVDQLLADLQGASVTAADATIEGLPSRCFDLSSGEGDVSVCVTTDGVVARLVVGESRLELVDLDGEAPEGGFEPPE